MALWRRAGAEDDTDVRRCDEENHRSLQGSPAPSSHHSGGHTAGPHSAVAPVGPHSPRIRPGCGRMDHHPVRGMDHLHEHPRDDRQHSARHIGVDLLAIVALVSTVCVQQYWASWAVVLMVASGEAIESYAQNKARGNLTALIKAAPQQAARGHIARRCRRRRGATDRGRLPQGAAGRRAGAARRQADHHGQRSFRHGPGERRQARLGAHRATRRDCAGRRPAALRHRKRRPEQHQRRAGAAHPVRRREGALGLHQWLDHDDDPARRHSPRIRSTSRS